MKVNRGSAHDRNSFHHNLAPYKIHHSSASGGVAQALNVPGTKNTAGAPFFARLRRAGIGMLEKMFTCVQGRLRAIRAGTTVRKATPTMLWVTARRQDAQLDYPVFAGQHLVHLRCQRSADDGQL
jgi:hypothetical protein